MTAPVRLLARLRAHTAPAHAALEAALLARAYFDSRDGYVEYLRRQLALQAGLERCLARAGAARVIPDWGRRRKVALVRRDLAALGATAARPAPLVGPPAVDGPADVLGVAYVLEGATLGGAVVLDLVRPLAVSAATGGRFLASYGRARGAMWRRFVAALAAWEARGVDDARVVAAAVAAFRTASDCLIGPPPAPGRSSPPPRRARLRRSEPHPAPTP